MKNKILIIITGAIAVIMLTVFVNVVSIKKKWLTLDPRQSLDNARPIRKRLLRRQSTHGWLPQRLRGESYCANRLSLSHPRHACRT